MADDPKVPLVNENAESVKKNEGNCCCDERIEKLVAVYVAAKVDEQVRQVGKERWAAWGPVLQTSSWVLLFSIVAYVLTGAVWSYQALVSATELSVEKVAATVIPKVLANNAETNNAFNNATAAMLETSAKNYMTLVDRSAELAEKAKAVQENLNDLSKKNAELMATIEKRGQELSTLSDQFKDLDSKVKGIQKVAGAWNQGQVDRLKELGDFLKGGAIDESLVSAVMDLRKTVGDLSEWKVQWQKVIEDIRAAQLEASVVAMNPVLRTLVNGKTSRGEDFLQTFWVRGKGLVLKVGNLHVGSDASVGGNLRARGTLEAKTLTPTSNPDDIPMLDELERN